MILLHKIRPPANLELNNGNLQPSQFCRYELTEQELLQGSALTSLQAYCIQNQIANIAAQKLNLTFDPDKPSDFTQQVAYLQGQIDALQHLLNTSEAALPQLNKF